MNFTSQALYSYLWETLSLKKMSINPVQLSPSSCTFPIHISYRNHINILTIFLKHHASHKGVLLHDWMKFMFPIESHPLTIFSSAWHSRPFRHVGKDWKRKKTFSFLYIERTNQMCLNQGDCLEQSWNEAVLPWRVSSESLFRSYRRMASSSSVWEEMVQGSPGNGFKMCFYILTILLSLIHKTKTNNTEE